MRLHCRAQLTDKIRQIASDLKGERITAKRFSELSGIAANTVIYRFGTGSWNEVLNECGLADREARDRYGAPILIEMLRDLYVERKRIPKSTDCGTLLPSYFVFKRIFGNWGNALRDAGLGLVAGECAA